MNQEPIKTKLYPASLASRCVVPIRKIVSTPLGDRHFGTGTGFHYRDQLGGSWLITNWHVLTGRRPDDPGFLLSDAPQSPYKIEVTYPSCEIGTFLPPVYLDIYENGRPIWKERLLDQGVDIVAIPVSPPEGARIPFVQEFSSSEMVAMQPGLDVVIIGFPFEHNKNMPFPIWKKAMISSEPGYTVFGQLQVLVDTPGMPGMSGSPVFTLSEGFSVSKRQYEMLRGCQRGDISALDALGSIDLANCEPSPCLTFAGIYAGATGKGAAGLERLALGRIMLAPMIEMIVKDGQPGNNPFPPEVHSVS
ncbi:serine protease [Geotalea sp. SG265]|uniref:S1 family peptidase n=1 Tax=Geotalea sp. SG265 TaxID=2922867 RepID=UPI001FAF6B77|nr:serine protease [Geotalea sp. SG265]